MVKLCIRILWDVYVYWLKLVSYISYKNYLILLIFKGLKLNFLKIIYDWIYLVYIIKNYYR